MIGKCELCGKTGNMEEHHYIPRARLQETKKIKLHAYCHQDVHNLDSEKFYRKYGKERNLFIKCKMIFRKEV